MKSKLSLMLILLSVLVLQGCETFKGAAEGLKKDIEMMDNKDHSVNKLDAWIQEHLW